MDKKEGSKTEKCKAPLECLLQGHKYEWYDKPETIKIWIFKIKCKIRVRRCVNCGKLLYPDRKLVKWKQIHRMIFFVGITCGIMAIILAKLCPILAMMLGGISFLGLVAGAVGGLD